MQAFRAIRRFLSVSWLVAAPLVILLLLILFPLAVRLSAAIAGAAFGPDAADTLVATAYLLFGYAFWAAILAAVVGFPLYAALRYLKKKAAERPGGEHRG